MGSSDCRTYCDSRLDPYIKVGRTMITFHTATYGLCQNFTLENRGGNEKLQDHVSFLRFEARVIQHALLKHAMALIKHWQNPHRFSEILRLPCPILIFGRWQNCEG
ncbi:hypothetical protein AMTR_s00131p00113650 [Amborella trichopoda]|uniref:Uncharacterized protein n=1 Tax=Amborella trichopoda TaxID=13333 RepID=W1NVV0_AMBTC|nr:hypothetical protein AMTR_s00131p00113650 [Amborella trichopoda]